MSPARGEAPALGEGGRSGALWNSLSLWLDSWAKDARGEREDAPEVDWTRILPFILLHVACLAVFAVGWSWLAVTLAAGFYALRMFAITAFYHRYFSHRTFRASRPLQFLFALLGASAVQRGPIWWASHHRAHHRHSDQEQDVHSPARRGFWWSHVGWVVARSSFRPRFDLVPDLMRFPELRFLDRFDMLVPFATVVIFYLGGEWARAAGWPTSGAQLVVWGFCISTVVTYHITFAINSVAHRRGSRAFATRDESRNNWLLALLTFGEGWHNNHHRYPASVRQGFRWWQVDLTYYLLRGMQAVGLVSDLKPVPERILNEARRP